VGTVTFEVGRAVKEAKAGKVEYRVDKAGVIHCRVGMVNFDEVKLTENIRALIQELIARKPATAKGVYVRAVSVSSTMGVGVKVDTYSATTMEEVA
jgi:large subunit ribosomal protein L1